MPENNPITYEQASELFVGLLKSQNIRGDIRFNYAWQRNATRLQSIQNQINKVRFPKETPSDKEMFGKMSKVESQLSEKGIFKGTPEYDKEFPLLMNSIEDEHPETRDKYRKHAELFAEFLKEPCEFEFYYMPIDCVPDMTEDQMNGLKPFIK